VVRALVLFVAIALTPSLLAAVAPDNPPQAQLGVPAGWPSSLQLGMSSGPGDAARMRATAPFGLRSQYLAGGANTGSGWSTWNTDGAFVTYYAQDSRDQGMRSIFDYYMLLQSQPATGVDEGAKDWSNLNNDATMRAYYADLKLFFMRAAAFPPNTVVLHFEPDLWGFLEQRSRGDDATTVSARVGATGVSDIAGLPDTAAGFARAVLKLRDQYAPGVLVAYHLSVWGTGNDILYSDPTDATVESLAARAATFYSSLGASFDLVFTDPSDRDAAFKQYEYGDGGASWWSAADYARNARFVARFTSAVTRPVVLWQVPMGNTKMRAMNNTWDHYQDNHVEWFLDDPGRTHLTTYANAGVVAIVFGRGADGATCACDSANDGVTDPASINGNVGVSLNADDDGGYFRSVAAAYYVAGALALGGAIPSPTSAPPTPSPTGIPAPTVSPSPTGPPPPGGCTASVGPGIAPPSSVAVGTPGLHASWYGQSGYPTLCAGERSTAVVAYYNSGSQGWVRGRMGEVAYLGTWDPEPGQDRPSPLGGDGQLGSPETGWPHYDRVAMQPADYVGPGQVAWFQFTIQAPATPGVYRLYLRPLIEGAIWLEDYGVFWVVAVR
jgi:hypothetical protein